MAGAVEAAPVGELSSEVEAGAGADIGAATMADTAVRVQTRGVRCMRRPEAGRVKGHPDIATHEDSDTATSGYTRAGPHVQRDLPQIRHATQQRHLRKTIVGRNNLRDAQNALDAPWQPRIWSYRSAWPQSEP